MMLKRRDFLAFFLIGGLVRFLRKRLLLKVPEQQKQAMFWKRKA